MSEASDKNVCTCPSGDGSLRWPCPVHPALLPCPFCGASAAVQNENPADNSGGYFVECRSCGASTNLRYACGDDPVPMLVAQWNTRTPQAVEAQAAPAAVAVQDAVQLLKNEAARLERLYGIRGWYGFADEKAAHIEHLRAAEALAATPALPATEDSSAGDLATESVLIEGKTYTIFEAALLEVARLNIELKQREVVQAEPVADWLPYSRRAALAARHGQKVTAPFNALVRDVIATYLDTRRPLAEQVPAEPVALQMCSDLKPRTESEKAAYLAGVADGRMYAERDAAKQGLEASPRADKQDGEANG